MEYSFPRYLLAKQTVDDRALNKDVLTALKSQLSAVDIRSSAFPTADIRSSNSPTADIRLSVSRQPSVPKSAFTVIEVGAGIGTMLTRLLRWNILPPNVDYTLVDEMPENITFARQWLPQWARENGYQVETFPDKTIRLSASTSIPQSVSIHFAQADVFDYIRFSASPSAPQSASALRFSDSSVVDSAPPSDSDLRFSDSSVVDSVPQSDSDPRFSDSSVVNSAPQSADLLIAHAFLDLLPMPESLPKLFSLLKPGGLAWLTINFDGITTLEPPFRLPDSSADDIRLSDSRQPSAPQSAVDIRLSASQSVPESVDSLIERLYHQTMDTRPTGGDSRSGRHLFKHLEQAGAEILAAGASDWVVYPVKGQYPADEAYFLHFILHFFETSLANHPELDPRLLEEWLKQRRAQIERAELVYIAHQMDFLISTR